MEEDAEVACASRRAVDVRPAGSKAGGPEEFALQTHKHRRSHPVGRALR